MDRRGASSSRGHGRGYQPPPYRSWQEDYGRKGFSTREDEFYSGAKQQQASKPFYKRKSASQNRHEEKRNDDFRKKKGEEIVEAYTAEWKKNFLVGFDSLEEVIKAKKFETLESNVIVPISTRTVGFSSQEIFFKND